eukprot:671639-Prymnesium_polylepis.1
MWHKCAGGQARKRSPAVICQSFDRVAVTLEHTLRLPTRFDSGGWRNCSTLSGLTRRERLQLPQLGAQVGE